MKSLKAFTIIEMLVVLLLSVFVFGIASTAWLYFERLENKLVDNQEYLFIFNRFDYLLKNDINNAAEIKGNKTDVFFELKKSQQKIHYQFLDTNIVRTQESISDTMNIHYNMKFLFTEKSHNLITQLDFIFELYDTKISKSYRKWYDNKTLLEHSDY